MNTIPEVYESKDVPGHFGYVGCDSDQYETYSDASDAAHQSVCEHQYVERTTAPLGVYCYKCFHFVGAWE